MWAVLNKQIFFESSVGTRLFWSLNTTDLVPALKGIPLQGIYECEWQVRDREGDGVEGEVGEGEGSRRR